MSCPWRFEAVWLQLEQCKKVVADSWEMCLNTERDKGISKQRVYASSRPLYDDIAKGTSYLQKVVDPNMTEDVMQHYMAAEVTSVLFQMTPLKSPGPMVLSKLGFPPPFFHLVMLSVSSVSYSFLLGESFSSLLQHAEQAIRDVLEVYRLALRQEINFSKYSVVFSKNTNKVPCLHIGNAFTITRENKVELYMGLPSRAARSKRDIFLAIRDRVWQKITSWNEKLLSQAEKEVLIQSVVRTVPTRLSISLLKEIHSMSTFFYVAQRAADQNLFRVGCRWRVGSSSLIRAWSEHWFPRPRSFRPITPAPTPSGNLYVSDLINPVSSEWDVGKVQELFWPLDTDVIVGIPLSYTGEHDLLDWHYSSNGMFSVRSAYHLFP
ncbi:UNVERIFIED_CONTAM: hypothetical protein Slati_3480400 [Sesamum latifolium]|uniref:Uncharacterized protein n=1 Tax=Sesamum latifolium TaxID=2727402 RepID=A0AAW2UGM0_9LAMI